LEKLYQDPLYTQQSGPRFWNRISSEYANISRSDCTSFLASKKVPQMMKKVPQIEIKPINSKYPRHFWALDFVDLKDSAHAYLGNCYLLNIIDHFSKYAWSFPLKERDSDLVTEKLRELFKDGHVPRILHADGEFKATSLVALCKEFDVKLISSEPYAPWQNGVIEVLLV
jgi:transposase InsO family protein